MRARPEIEQLLGRTVYLELRVKVRAEVAPQRDDARALRALTYTPREWCGYPYRPPSSCATMYA